MVIKMNSTYSKRLIPLIIASIILISIIPMPSVRQDTPSFTPYSNTSPYVVGSDAVNYNNYLALNFNASLYLYGYGTSGICPASPFANGSLAVGVGENGYNDTGLAITTSSINSYNPYGNSHYTIGGVGVSGFSSHSTYYAVNTPPIQPATTINLTFNVTSYSLVVIMGMIGGAFCISLSGIPGMKIDSILNYSGDVGLEISQAYLNTGKYTVIENSTNGDGGSNTRSEILSASVFYSVTSTNSSTSTSSTTPLNLQEFGLIAVAIIIAASVIIFTMRKKK